MKLLFTASAGGHLEELMMLRPLMEKYDSVLVTERTGYKIELPFRTYKVSHVNRKEKSFPFRMVIIFFKSLYIVIKEKPDAVITTGVLATIPICVLAKIFKKKLIYIESFARISSSDMTGNFLHKYADRFYVQWEEMLKVFPDAIYLGGIF